MKFKDLVYTILKNMKYIVIFPIIFVCLYSYYNYATKTPDYSATATLYVIDGDNTSVSNIAYIQALMNDYQQLASTSFVRIKTQKALGVAEYPNLGNTVVTVSINTERHVMFITTKGKNPATCANVANVYSTAVIEYINEKLGATNITVLEAASMPTEPSGPIRKKPILYAGVAGLAVGVAVILIIELSNTSIRTPDDIAKEYNLPVLAEIVKFKKKG